MYLALVLSKNLAGLPELRFGKPDSSHTRIKGKEEDGIKSAALV